MLYLGWTSKKSITVICMQIFQGHNIAVFAGNLSSTKIRSLNFLKLSKCIWSTRADNKWSLKIAPWKLWISIVRKLHPIKIYVWWVLIYMQQALGLRLNFVNQPACLVQIIKNCMILHAPNNGKYFQQVFCYCDAVRDGY